MAFVHPATKDITLEGVLSALGDPLRLKIIQSLLEENGCMSCCRASPCPDIPKSTISNHFRILREAGTHSHNKKGCRTSQHPPHRRPQQTLPRPDENHHETGRQRRLARQRQQRTLRNHMQLIIRRPACTLHRHPLHDRRIKPRQRFCIHTLRQITF